MKHNLEKDYVVTRGKEKGKTYPFRCTNCFNKWMNKPTSDCAPPSFDNESVGKSTRSDSSGAFLGGEIQRINEIAEKDPVRGRDLRILNFKNERMGLSKSDILEAKRRESERQRRAYYGNV